MTAETVHSSVLLEEIVDYLRPEPEGEPTVVLDGTLGGGGHSEALLRRFPSVSVIGLDRDPAAVERCRVRLAPFESRLRLVHSNFAEAESVVRTLEMEEVDPEPSTRIGRALLDLGLSSDQLADTERGFSFQHDSPLDMRMSAGVGPTAAELVNSLSPRDLRLLFVRGGLPNGAAHALARSIIRARPLVTTTDFSRLCHDALPMREKLKHRNPATVPFQALRMAVNDEMGSLERFLDGALRWLAPSGRLAVIAFHSSEDRIVTQTMRRWSQKQHRSDGTHSIGTLLTKKAVLPSAEEVEANPRARSARLRVFERSAEELERARG